MTMPAVPPPAPPAPPQKPSAAAFWAAQLDQSAFEEVVKEVAKEHAQAFHWKREALLKAIHLRQQTPAERLAGYMARPAQTWDLLRNILPLVFKQQTEDWHALEAKVASGEMAPPAPPGPAPVGPAEPLPQIYEPGQANIYGPRGPLAGAAQRYERGYVQGEYTKPPAGGG